MKTPCVVAALVLLLSVLVVGDTHTTFLRTMSLTLSPHSPQANKNMPCVVCTVGLSVVVTTATQQQKAVDVLVDEICDLLDKVHQPTLAKDCKALWKVVGPIVLHELSLSKTADDICHTLSVCSNSTCLLGPLASPRLQASHHHLKGLSPTGTPASKPSEELRSAVWDFIHILRSAPMEWPWDKVVDHLPFEDADNDTFSIINTLRGSDWRGKDCDDSNGHVYPGRIPSLKTPYVDDNCNGIVGVDPTTGVSYEETFCEGSQPRGVIVMGDSASAHFHVPQNDTAPLSMEHMLEDELDYPQCSWATGHQPTGMCPWAAGLPMDSIYGRLVARNRCNHRDFQNISVNGARTSSMHASIMQTLSRNQQTDRPVTVFYALVGNDVCNGHPGFDHMTKPADFRANVLSAMHYLDTKLPAGSHVVFVGLEHGLMWDVMAKVVHPSVGTTYGALWNFIGCQEVSPCWGWLNEDPAVRNATTQWAHSLDQVYRDIIASESAQFKNFDMHYFDNPDVEVSQEWVATGRNPVQLYEWIGGGHPSQVMHVLTAAKLWESLEKVCPEALGPVNPHNQDIQNMFGDQGGY